MLDADVCGRILRESFPELPVHSLRYFAEGWDYELWEANAELLFRFPRRQECAGPLRKEARLLPELADALSVPVPRPEYVSDGCDAFPMPFLGYRKLPGLPLDGAGLSGQRGAVMARGLAQFLSELHRFPRSRAAALGVPHYTAQGWREHYRAFHDQTNRDVVPLLLAGEQSRIESFWRHFLDNDEHFRFEPVLLHADLGLEHILVHQDRAKVAAVIDFADAMIGDPALDFVGFDEGLRRDVLAGYDLPVDATLRSRAVAYWKLGPFHEVLYGLQIRDRGYVETGLEGIRLRLDRPK